MNLRLSILLAVLAALLPVAAFARDDADAPAPSTASTNAPNPTDKSYLELVYRRNIFDPTRVSSRPRVRAPRVEYFTFVGGAFESTNAVAFFSGVGASNRPLRPGDTINGFKVAEVTFHSVKLQPATGAVVTLNMGGNMRREPRGPWKPTEESEPPPESGGADGAISDNSGAPGETVGARPAAAISARDSDIIKRLKARHNDD